MKRFIQTSIGSFLSFLWAVPVLAGHNPSHRRYDSTIVATQLEARNLLRLLETFAGFMILSAEILAGIVIIWAGLAYMAAGSNPTKVTSAKQIFKNGLIGALILFAVGVILNTIISFATNPDRFFQ